MCKKEKKDATTLYVQHFNKDWEPVTEEDTYSVLVVPYTKTMQDGVMENYEVYVYRLKGYPSVLQKKEHVELFQLSFSKYRTMD